MVIILWYQRTNHKTSIIGNNLDSMGVVLWCSHLCNRCINCICTYFILFWYTSCIQGPDFIELIVLVLITLLIFLLIAYFKLCVSILFMRILILLLTDTCAVVFVLRPPISHMTFASVFCVCTVSSNTINHSVYSVLS